MGSQFSIPSDVRYVYTNNGVSVPYVRLINGQWVPLQQQQQQQWYVQRYGSQRHFPMMTVGNVYPR